MPFDINGQFSRLFNWVTEQATPPIAVSKLDTQEEDIATALSNCVLRDGTGLPASVSEDTEGSFTGTFTGGTTSPTVTVYWSRTGNKVTLFFGTGNTTFTSNATSMTITGSPFLPASVHPHITLIYGVTDDALAYPGTLLVAASTGVITFTVVKTYGALPSGTGFTASGTKGVNFAYVPQITFDVAVGP